MTSHIKLESRLCGDESAVLHRRPATADHVEALREPVSSVLAAYRQQTCSMPYWPAATTSPPGDVIMTSYGAGYVVHPGTSGLVSPWMGPTPMPSVERLSEFGGVCGGAAAGGYGSHGVAVVPPLSAYGGGVDVKPWPANNYMASPSSAVSPPFHAMPPLTSRIYSSHSSRISIAWFVYSDCSIGIGAQANFFFLGGGAFWSENIGMKSNKMPEFYIFVRKMPEFCCSSSVAKSSGC